jgi:hypothetical protein
LFLFRAAGCDGEPATSNGPDAPAPATEAGQWQALFNGKDLSGWHSYGRTEPGAEWVVADGAIVLDVDDDTTETTAGTLLTDAQFENFELELEWKISPGGNSGIFFGVTELDGVAVAYESGVEMQVLDDGVHPDGKEPRTSAGACYALYAPENKTLRPVGEYNTVRLVVNEGKVENWLNGRRVVAYDMNSDDWAERVAASKFADWEHFAKYRKGHIALQDHTDRVWFRNIRIRQL